MRIIGLDHVVIQSSDVEATLDFYGGVLGLELLNVEEWRRGEMAFPSARIDATTILDFMSGAPDGKNVDHVCLVIEPTDLEALAARPELNVLEGPVPRWGAQGLGWSLYLWDPDAQLIELRHYDDDPRAGAGKES